jgi:hypothetical protein
MFGELDDRGWLLDDALIEADRHQAEAEYDPASFWEGYREDELPVDQRDWSEAA